MIAKYVLAAAMLASGVAHAGGDTKEECVDAHSRGQDAKDQGKLSLARKLFLTCAQPSCPSVVQSDCARFADDLTRQQPSLTFAARDGNGADLPDTTVYVDDSLVVTRLDGKPHDVDPGTHTVKFSNNGKDQVVTIVVGAGEKARAVTATFGSPTPTDSKGSKESAVEVKKPSGPRTTHPFGAKAAMIGGAVIAAGGVGLAFYGLSKVPAVCDTGTHQCAAPPGDPVFNDANQAMRLSSIGWAVGGIGVAALAGGIVWYVTGKKTESLDQTAIAPWFNANGGGIAFGGHL